MEGCSLGSVDAESKLEGLSWINQDSRSQKINLPRLLRRLNRNYLGTIGRVGQIMILWSGMVGVARVQTFRRLLRRAIG